MQHQDADDFLQGSGFDLHLVWFPVKFDELADKKLPLHERESYIGKENEPRDWVHTPVEDVRHIVEEYKTKQESKNNQNE